MSQERDVDVVVVGGGGAGMSAALMAAENGASVMLIEADTKLGGSTALSGGVYYAADTSVQRAKGISGDSADAMFEYYMTLNQYRVEASLARTLSDRASEGLDWLMKLGVEFRPADLYASGVESIERGHTANGSGAAIAAALDRAVAVASVASSARAGAPAQAIDVVLNTRVEGLLRDAEGGRVIGVRAGGTDVFAGAVVLTTGGFGANPHWLHTYYPDATVHGDAAWYIGSAHCQGDGLSLARQVGADIVGYNRGLLLTTPNFAKVLEAAVPSWLIYVNREGRRFVKENAAYAVMSGAVQAQTGGTCFALFDDVAMRSAKPAPEFADAFAAGVLPLNWIAEELEAQVRAGRVIAAATLDELATKCGIRQGALHATTTQYNEDVAAGVDSLFFKSGDGLLPIRTPPFYAVEIRPAIVCLTSTGVRINAAAQVLDDCDRPIRGLFAAGETTGGVLGDRYIGGGNSITNAIVFGRVAGVSAALAAQGNE